MKAIYLDNNATTPCANEVIEAMLPFFGHGYGNSESPHLMGRQASKAVALAREHVADLLGCAAADVIFTSGATESNNIVFLGLLAQQTQRRAVAVSAVEHKSVLAPCDYLETAGISIERIPVTPAGTIMLEVLRTAVNSETCLVSVQAANNETGVVQPVQDAAAISHSSGALFHCDASQAVGKIPVSVIDLNADFVSVSAHKLYGPKGCGALYVANAEAGKIVRPLLFGGGQEEGIRPGTLNVPAIVGFGEACRIAAARLKDDIDSISALRHRLEWDILSRVPGARVNGLHARRLPNTTSITIPAISADLLIANVLEVCFSNGSACTSGSLSPSHVLLAMGLSREESQDTIRLSLGRQNTPEEIDEAASLIVKAAHSLRGLAE